VRNHEKLINKQNMNKIIKTSKKVNKFKMQTYQFHLLNEQMLTNNLISQSISKFWEEKIIGKKVCFKIMNLLISLNLAKNIVYFSSILCSQDGYHPPNILK